MEKNAKSTLFELSAKFGLEPPDFSVIKDTGPSHKKIFQIQVRFNGETFVGEEKSTKKDAEASAASIALSKFNKPKNSSGSEQQNSKEDDINWKNALQEFCVKNGMSIPIYKTELVVGSAVPRFNSTVYIGDENFDTKGQYSSKKDAEKGAAAEVYKIVSERPLPTPNQQKPQTTKDDAELDNQPTIPEEDPPSEFPVNWKNKLQETCVKNRIALPKYSCQQSGPSHQPNFEVTIELQGKKYTTASKRFRDKKTAEQFAAKIGFHNLPKSNDPNGNSILDSYMKEDANVTEDYKSKLQVFCQKRGHATPEYLSTVATSNLNVPLFETEVSAAGGKWKSKKAYPSKSEAEQDAAKVAFEELKKQLESDDKKIEERRKEFVSFSDNDNNSGPPTLKKKSFKYQLEMYERAMEENIICALPTGTGKTQVACLVIEKMLKINPKKKALFIVDRLPLVKQQAKVFREETGRVVEEIHGGNSSNAKILLEKGVIIVVIADVLLKMLADQVAVMEDFCIIVFDEIHHALKEHSYNKIAEQYKKASELSKPKLLGLSASPAEAKDEIRAIIKFARLGIRMEAKICVPIKNVSELVERTNDIKADIEKLGVTEAEMKFIRLLKSASDEISIIRNESVIIRPEEMKAIQNLEKLEEEEEADTESNEELEEDTDDTSSSSSSSSNELTIDLPKLQQIEEDVLNFGFEYAYNRLLELVKPFYRLFTGSFQSDLKPKEYGKDTCKATYLVQYLLDFFSKNSDKKVAVFVKTRHNAAKLKEVLEKKLNGIQVSVTTGRGPKNQNGMSLGVQHENLEKFRNEAKVLISTSVSEEGVDVASCQCVIRFDCPTNVASLIQSRGRARARGATFLLLVKSPYELKKLNEVMAAEENTRKAIVHLQNKTIPDMVESGNPIGDLYQLYILMYDVAGDEYFKFEQSVEKNTIHTTILRVEGMEGSWKASSTQKQQSKADACEKLLKEKQLIKHFLDTHYYKTK